MQGRQQQKLRRGGYYFSIFSCPILFPLIWELLRKVTSLGPNLWLLWKVTSLNLWPFERSQVWAQTCDFCKSHNFWPKLVTFRFKLVTFTKGHKFKVVTFAQSCDLSKLVTFTKGHKFKLVTFYKGHKFGPKGHKFGPKVVTFTKVTSLDPNLWPFETSQV